MAQDLGSLEKVLRLGEGRRLKRLKAQTDALEQRVIAEPAVRTTPVEVVADLSDTARIFAATKFNGDGIVPAETAPNKYT